jgi:hypothetical protein
MSHTPQPELYQGAGALLADTPPAALHELVLALGLFHCSPPLLKDVANNNNTTWVGGITGGVCLLPWFTLGLCVGYLGMV